MKNGVLPQEFIQFVLEQLKTLPLNELDVHWRPQYSMCPYCLLNFSVYSLLEENDKDSYYFFKKAGLLEKVNVTLKKNVHGNAKDSRTKR